MDAMRNKIIQELMEELLEKMEHSPEELTEKLGRPKPEGGMAVMEIKASPEEEHEMDMDEEPSMFGGDEEDQGDDSVSSLKKKLMQVRG